MRHGARLAFIVGVVAFLVFGREHFFGEEVRSRPAAQRVTLLTPERSLPKPPEPEKPKPVEVADVPVEASVATARDVANEPAPVDDRLGVDADAGPGSDGFGLAAKRGGRDITTLGETAPGGGAGRLDARIAFAGYAAGLERALQDQLERAADLRTEEYTVVVRLWIGRDGKVTRWEFGQSRDRERIAPRLSRAFAELPALSAPPPDAMPQPVVLRLTARRSG